MEFEKELYKRAISHLRLSRDIGKELIAMTETKRPKKYILRRLAVAAAITMLAAALAMGANAATDGALYEATIGKIVSVELKDGGNVEITVKPDADVDSDSEVEIVIDETEGHNMVVRYNEETCDVTVNRDIESVTVQEAN